MMNAALVWGLKSWNTRCGVEVTSSRNVFWRACGRAIDSQIVISFLFFPHKKYRGTATFSPGVIHVFFFSSFPPKMRKWYPPNTSGPNAAALWIKMSILLCFFSCQAFCLLKIRVCNVLGVVCNVGVIETEVRKQLLARRPRRRSNSSSRVNRTRPATLNSSNRKWMTSGAEGHSEGRRSSTVTFFKCEWRRRWVPLPAVYVSVFHAVGGVASRRQRRWRCIQGNTGKIKQNASFILIRKPPQI